MFGAERCMYGSNFPIEKLWTDYATLYRTFREAIAAFSDHDKGARLRPHVNASDCRSHQGIAEKKVCAHGAMIGLQ